MKYRIGILEMGSIHHNLLDLCKVYNLKNVKLTVFTSLEYYKQAKNLETLHDNIEWIVKKPGETNLRFLLRVQKVCNQRIDLLDIRAVKQIEFWFFWPKTKTILAAFDGVFFFMPAKLVKNVFSSLLNSYNPIIIIKHLLYLLIAIRAWLFVKQSSAVYTVDSAVRNWLLSHITINKKFYQLPHSPFEGTLKFNSNQLVITIPGMIHDIRRDYDLALKVISYLFSKYGEKIKVYLLGKPIGEYGRRIITLANQLQQKGYNIAFFTKYVSISQYSDIYNGSDLIFSPLNIYNFFRGKKEIYSKTMPSGIIQDTHKFGKPVIVPESFNVPKEFKSSFLKYKNESHLKSLLEELLFSPTKIGELKLNAYNNSKKNYSLPQLQSRMIQMLREIV